MKAKSYTVLLISSEAWATLHEVLVTHSSALAPDLREIISKALDEVQPITAQVGILLDVTEEVPRCAHLNNPAVGAVHVIGEDRMTRLQRALRFFRSPYQMLGGKRQYKKRLV